MWLTSVNDSRRLRSDCAIAPSTPKTSVAQPTATSIGSMMLPGKSSVSVRMTA